MNLAKNFAFRREILSRFPSRSRFYFGRQGSCRDSWKHPGEILAAEKLLPGENLDEIRGRIPARFWLPRFSLSGENHSEIRGRIPARFWPPRFLLPGENHGEIPDRVAARFWPPGISLPGENLAGVPPGFPPREKISPRPKSRRDPGGIPVEIAAGSRQDPGPYFTRVVFYFIGT